MKCGPYATRAQLMKRKNVILRVLLGGTISLAPRRAQL